MISENVAKECKQFCDEYRDILTQSAFNQNTIEHISVRMIQKVAGDVQSSAAVTPSKTAQKICVKSNDEPIDRLTVQNVIADEV